MENRKVPEIMMDILKNYSMVDGGEKPLLDYLNELMNAYTEMEREFYDLSLWQQDIKKDIREMQITLKQYKDDNEK